MKFTVVAMEIMSSGKKQSGKISLKEKDSDRRTIFESLIFLHIPLADFPLYCLGKEIDFPLPEAAVAAVAA